MRRYWHWLVLLAAATVGACVSRAPVPIPRRTLAIIGGSIIDPASDSPPQSGTVIIVGSRIIATDSNTHVPPGATVIDARGKFLLPGLWDMHAHLAALNSVGRKPEGYIGHGVLAVRDMGGFLDSLLALKSEIAAGRAGPTIVMAGPTLNGKSFAAFHQTVATEADGRAAVHGLKASGVNLVKVHRAMDPEVMRAILDEARRVGMPVVGHVPLGLSWIDAADAGMYSMEHVQTLVESELADRRNPAEDIPSALVRLEGAHGDSIFATLARNGTYFDPTLISYENSIGNAAPDQAAQRRALYDRLKPFVGRANAAGVAILTGTDMVDRPGEWLLVELERLVEAGLSPRHALRAATTTAAQAAGRPDLARIAPDATASLLILDADPLADIRNVRRLSTVVLHGRPIDSIELARLRTLDR